MTAHRFHITSIPPASWLRTYPLKHLPDDLNAGLITALLLIPQAMAYAMLAGLPPQAGLYASIFPPLLYGVLGTSRILSIGPASVTSLLVASAMASSAMHQSDPGYLLDALLLTALCGCILIVMAIMRLEILVNFIGHPVLSGFTSGAAVFIVIGQLGKLTGTDVTQAGTALDQLWNTLQRLPALQGTTAVIGLVSLLALVLLRSCLTPFLRWCGIPASHAALICRASPIGVLGLAMVTVAANGLNEQGVDIIGGIPAGFPDFNLSFFEFQRIEALLPSAMIISVMAYVESVSIARVLAGRRREKIDYRHELIALGAANLVSGVSGGMPVAGGFSRSMVNFSAGATSQVAGVVAGLAVACVTMFFTRWFYFVPEAVLAAIIMVAVLPLFDWRTAIKTFHYDLSDGLVLLTTFVSVLIFGIEFGLCAGVSAALAAFVWRSSRPHMAVVGRLPGTEYFRNVHRHVVQTWPGLLLVRVDRSLYFANMMQVERFLTDTLARQGQVRHLVIVCSGINEIDHSAMKDLVQLAESLRSEGITLHLADVKGPVMDRLLRTDFLKRIAPGQIFLTPQKAVEALAVSLH